MRGTGMARWMLTSGMWRPLSKSLLFAVGMSNWSPAAFSTPSFLRGRPTMIHRKIGGGLVGLRGEGGSFWCFLAAIMTRDSWG